MAAGLADKEVVWALCIQGIVCSVCFRLLASLSLSVVTVSAAIGCSDGGRVVTLGRDLKVGELYLRLGG